MCAVGKDVKSDIHPGEIDEINEMLLEGNDVDAEKYFQNKLLFEQMLEGARAVIKRLSNKRQRNVKHSEKDLQEEVPETVVLEEDIPSNQPEEELDEATGGIKESRKRKIPLECISSFI